MIAEDKFSDGSKGVCLIIFLIIIVFHIVENATNTFYLPSLLFPQQATLQPIFSLRYHAYEVQRN